MWTFKHVHNVVCIATDYSLDLKTLPCPGVSFGFLSKIALCTVSAPVISAAESEVAYEMQVSSDQNMT